MNGSTWMTWNPYGLESKIIWNRIIITNFTRRHLMVRRSIQIWNTSVGNSCAVRHHIKNCVEKSLPDSIYFPFCYAYISYWNNNNPLKIISCCWFSIVVGYIWVQRSSLIWLRDHTFCQVLVLFHKAILFFLTNTYLYFPPSKPESIQG